MTNQNREPEINNKPPLKEQLAGLVAFLHHFEQPGFSPGEWGGGQKAANGSVQMPYFSFSQVARDFIRATYDLNWLDGGFDWGRWMSSEEAVALREDPQVLGAATPEQLSRLLTVVVRGERFCDGTVEAEFRSGLIPAICRRAAVLLAEMDCEGD